MQGRIVKPAIVLLTVLSLATLVYLYLGFSDLKTFDSDSPIFKDDRPPELRRLYSAEFRQNAEFAIGIHLGYSYAYVNAAPERSGDGL